MFIYGFAPKYEEWGHFLKDLWEYWNFKNTLNSYQNVHTAFEKSEIIFGWFLIIM